MPRRQNHHAGALVLALALGSLAASGVGCAGFAASEAEELPPLPATIVEIRAAIGAERAQLMDLVGEPADDSQPSGTHTDALIEIAERLSRLQAALERLELEAESKPTAP